ncbi:MAG: hypothetical protein KAQ71_12325, partial [Desulfobulbaceae bacterium]|nr:hypothetical protein [Desulfobulbaceae bacterium]
MKTATCVTPEGVFQYSLHEPEYPATNLREHDYVSTLGECEKKSVDNSRNFPADSIKVVGADHIYEIPNAFPFKGTTYINSRWADKNAGDPLAIRLEKSRPSSFSKTVSDWLGGQRAEHKDLDTLFSSLPEGVLLAIATTSTDPDDLVRLAALSGEFIMGDNGLPTGLAYESGAQGLRPKITHHDLFEAVANNPFLPDTYKDTMLLRPGAQGGSEIVGDW